MGAGATQTFVVESVCDRQVVSSRQMGACVLCWRRAYTRNAYTYGRPVNIEATRSSIPTLSFEDGDAGGATTPKESEIAVFIAMCRLSSVLEGLLPLVLDRDVFPRRQNLDRSLLRHAASDLEMLYRDLPDDLLFDPTQSSPRPGSRKFHPPSFSDARLSAALPPRRRTPHLPSGARTRGV